MGAFSEEEFELGTDDLDSDLGDFTFDEDGYTSDVPFARDSMVVDKIVNWGVCGIALVAIATVGFFVIRQQLAPAPAAPTKTPAAQSTSGGTVTPQTAATIEKAPPTVTDASAATTPAPRAERDDRRKTDEPEEVEVPVVVEIREHRNTPTRKMTNDDDGR